MKNVTLSVVYEMLLKSLARFPKCSADPDELQMEMDGADAELASDIELFQTHVCRLQDSLRTGDTTTITESLVYVRVFAMNISSIFSNLATSIEEVAFTSVGRRLVADDDQQNR